MLDTSIITCQIVHTSALGSTLEKIWSNMESRHGGNTGMRYGFSAVETMSKTLASFAIVDWRSLF